MIFRGYAWAVVALRFLIVPAWIAAAVLATIRLPGLESEKTGALADLVASDAPALRAQARSAEHFGVPVVADTLVVQRDPDGLSRDAQLRVFERARAIFERRYRDLLSVSLALPVTNTLGLFPSARERSTTGVTYLFFEGDHSVRTKERLASEFERKIRPGDGLAGTTGAAPARLEQFEQIRDALPIVTVATVLVIAVLVGLNFSAPAAPLVVLLAAGVAYLVDIRLLGWLSGRMGVSIPSEIEPLLVVLLLGAVTDYAIFYLSGHRRRLSEGTGSVEAARQVTASVTPIVLVAGLTVAAGTGALAVSDLEFLRAFGPGLALTALVAVAVAITLVPATIALLGRLTYWPSAGRREVLQKEAGRAGWSWRQRVAYWATSKPLAVLIALVCVAGLAAATSGLVKTSLGFELVSGLPPGTEPHRAARAAGQGFAPGIVAPTEVLVEQRGIADREAELARLRSAVSRERGVAGVVGPGFLPFRDEYGAVVSRDGGAARYVVIFDRDPFDAAAIGDLERLQARLPLLLGRAGLADAQAAVSGGTALASETIDQLVSDLWRVALVVLAANFILLAVFLRSLVAPLYLLAASVLALGGALGLTTYLFQDVLGHGQITYYVPFAAAVLLVALGSDYNIFVAGRIWEEAKLRPLREAVAVAGPRAARAITVAGLVLAASFALLALVPLRPFRELAFVMCAGVLIDSFLVRSFLVPALVSVFGAAGGWPSRRLRHPAAVAETSSTPGRSGIG